MVILKPTGNGARIPHHRGHTGLDGGYTVFGEVIEGLNVVENIQSTATDSHDRPQTDIVILHAVVEQKSKKAGATGKRRYSPGLY